MKYLNKIKNYRLAISNSSGQISIVLIFLAMVIFSIFIGKSISFQSPLLVFGFIGGFIIVAVTMFNTDLALAILIFSMLLSPEIPIAQTPERAVVLRMDDILLILMFFTWLAKMAINKELGLLKKTAINTPLAFYIFISIFSTTLALVLGIGEAKLSNAFFYILKTIEYFMLYFLVVNNIKNIKQVKIYTFLFLLVCFLICIYGYYQLKAGAIRASAPFEGKHAEPNSLSGYLLVMISITMGLLLHLKSPGLKLLLFGLACVMIYILLFTLSRGAYLGILIAYLSLIFLSKKGRFALVMVALLATVLLPTFIPIEVVNRIKHTFIPGREFEIMGTPITLDVSVSDRVLQINEVLTQWVKSPLFGYGITGLGFKEGQYVRLLGEIGIVGLVIFFWLIFRLLKNILKSYQTTEDDFAKGISLGLLVSLIGLLFHSWSANVFIIVRIMEPFWFLAALVISLPELSTKETLS